MSSIDETAMDILGAYASGVPIAPVRGRISGVAQAYAVQQRTVAHWRQAGRRVVGRKIGLTNKTVQDQLGVHEPDFGTLFADMIVPDGGSVPHGAVMQPRVEAEIAFILNSDLDGVGISAEDVVEATDYVCPALEICGSRIANWDIRIEDTVADNASSALLVLGAGRAKPVVTELPLLALTMAHNGQCVLEGRGEACLGNPAVAVAWLAEALTRFGDKLKAGDIVLSGALARMLPAAGGDTFAADFGGFGSVSVRFAS
jgi:2-keto-4-pentenoate hydratase